jgi:hypothetical protein
MTTTTIWHVTMSLDGFIAGPEDELDWGFGHGRVGPMASEAREDHRRDLGRPPVA